MSRCFGDDRSLPELAPAPTTQLYPAPAHRERERERAMETRFSVTGVSREDPSAKVGLTVIRTETGLSLILWNLKYYSNMRLAS